MEKKTVLQLVNRLNAIEIEKNNLEIAMMKLDKEYNEIIYELWNTIPSLKDDPNLQPMVKKKEIK